MLLLFGAPESGAKESLPGVGVNRENRMLGILEFSSSLLAVPLKLESVEEIGTSLEDSSRLLGSCSLRKRS